MFCLEGTAAMTHFSLRNTPDICHEPLVFSAVSVKDGELTYAKVLEGPVQEWKIFNSRSSESGGAGNGQAGKHYGLPRFAECSFEGSFPFGSVKLSDDSFPVEARVVGWSPFDPSNADDSSFSAAALEFTLVNRTERPLELVYSFHAANFMALEAEGARVTEGIGTGSFVLEQRPSKDKPWIGGAFHAATDQTGAVADCAWFRGGWFDPVTMVGDNIESGRFIAKPPLDDERPSPGASLYVPLTLEPGGERQVRLMLSWYVPETNVTTEGYDKNAPDGGVMKVYREWRISGDTDWMKRQWPKVKASLHYCMKQWDPEGKGILIEPHHNTYDIEFWGPDGNVLVRLSGCA